jgi:hypothetical protein
MDLQPHTVRFNFSHNSRGSQAGLAPELKAIIPKVTAVYRETTGNPHFKVEINAGQEWHNGHKIMSLHHTGYAADFQTKLLPGGGAGEMAKHIERGVSAALGPKYRVELELHPPHLHVEFRGGLKMSNPGDFPPPTSA